MNRLLLLVYLLCSFEVRAQDKLYSERYRPQFHYTPAKNWCNDPNGLVYFNGNYHLFFQYNPEGNRWGHMSWGHAISHDLVHWKQLPLAIPEEKGFMIFSGSAVLDTQNTSGLARQPGSWPMVAVYTGNMSRDPAHPEQTIQAQQIAYSLDSGTKWTQYAKNPVIDLHLADFRDPSAFWYAPDKKWILATVLPKEHVIRFYSSPNLIEWTQLSDFGPAGDTTDIWECPSLVEVPIADGGGKKKWVLFNSLPGTMQYFVGEFDGQKFTSENPPSKIFRPDYGSDFYAGIVYNDLPAGHFPILLGWANNWAYAQDIPTSPWKGMMSLPRALSLKKDNQSWILLQRPVQTLSGLRNKSWEKDNIQVNGTTTIPMTSNQCEIEMSWHPKANEVSGIYLAEGKGRPLKIGYDANQGQLFFDRTGVGEQSFNAAFGKRSGYSSGIHLKNGELTLRIFFDHSLVEIFANDGESVMTLQIFPAHGNDRLALFSEKGNMQFDRVSIWTMKSIW